MKLYKVYGAEAAEVVVEVLHERLPAVEEVDLVQIQRRSAVLDVVLDDLVGLAGGQPDVVEGKVEGRGRTAVRLLHPLEQERRLARPARAEDGDEPRRPVDPAAEVAAERKIRFRQTAFGDFVDFVQLLGVHVISLLRLLVCFWFPFQRNCSNLWF